MAKGLPKSIIKKYGITKKAWQVFRGTRSHFSSVPGGKKTMAKRKTKAKSSPKRRAGAFGGLKIKELLFGAALMTAGKVAVGMVAPDIPFQRQVGTLAGGAAAAITGLPGKRLITYGVMDAGSDILASFMGGAGSGVKTGGYDF